MVWDLEAAQCQQCQGSCFIAGGLCLAAWFPGGATILQAYLGSFPAPRRTGRGASLHSASSPRPPHQPWIEGVNNARCRQQPLEHALPATMA